MVTRQRRAPTRRADPVRTCVGCRRRGSPDGMVRIARGRDGAVRPGRTQPGRGAWVCAGDPGCFDQAVRRRALARALRTELSDRELAGLRGMIYGGLVSRDQRPAGRAVDGTDPSGEC